MIKSKNKPSFLNNLPIGEDLLEGKPHKKTADILYEVILEKKLPGNVIGLEGSWGAGKSNVIEILKTKFDSSNKSFTFFTYDAWGHQEDLTRKTFLEGVIDKLLSGEKSLKGKTDWSAQLNKLTAKISRKNVEKNPRVRFFLVPLFLGILIFSILKVIYADFFDGVDLWSKYNVGFFKPLALKYFVPSGFFIWSGIEAYREYRRLLDEDFVTATNNWRGRFSKLFYWFNGQNIETSEKEHVIEEEPSVKQFKTFLNKLTDDLSIDGLIIVFDNMDRLSSNEKLLTLWSSIHTFFAENHDQNTGKITVIVPYDKLHLQSYFGKRDEKESSDFHSYINKTFSTVFRVPPPVFSDWKTFYELKLQDAFGELISSDKRRVMSSLFELNTTVENRSPRDIISLINRLVALHLRHDGFSILHLAIFIHHESQILTNPQTRISNKGYFNKESHLITDWKELEQNLAAIVYGVDKNKADEVLLHGTIEELLKTGDEELLASIKSHSQFQRYFNQAIQKTTFSSNSYKTVPKTFDEVKDVISISMQQANWRKLASDFENLSNSEFESFDNWHKQFLENAPEDLALAFGQRILDSTHDMWINGERIESIKDSMGYYYIPYKVFEFCTQNNLAFRDKLIPPKTKFTGEHFVYYLDDFQTLFEEAGTSLEKMNIYADSSEICKYFIEHKDGPIHQLYEFIHVLKFLQEYEGYDLKEVKLELRIQIGKVQYSEEELIGKLISLNDVLSNYRRILFSSNMVDNYFNTNGRKGKYHDIFIMNQIGQLNKLTSKNSVLEEELNKVDNHERFVENIQNYISWGDLLKLSLSKDNNYALVKALAKELNNNSKGNVYSLDALWLFKNLHEIINVLFNDDNSGASLFFSRLESLAYSFKDKINSENVIELPFEVHLLALGSLIQLEPNTVINQILGKTVEYFGALTSQDWSDILGAKSHKERVFQQYLKYGHIDPKITKSKNFMTSYSSFMNGIAKKDFEVPDQSFPWNKLLDDEMLDKRRLGTIFTNCLEILIAQAEISKDRVKFFIKPILLFAKTKPHSDDIIRKMVIPSKDDADIFDYLITKLSQELVKLINSSKHENDQTLFDTLEYGLKNNFTEEKQTVEDILTSTNLIHLRSASLEEKEEQNEKSSE